MIHREKHEQQLKELCETSFCSQPSTNGCHAARRPIMKWFRRNRARLSRVQSARWQPQLEALEDRMLLSGGISLGSPTVVQGISSVGVLVVSPNMSQPTPAQTALANRVQVTPNKLLDYGDMIKMRLDQLASGTLPPITPMHGPGPDPVPGAPA
jgi:hypothetical protein